MFDITVITGNYPHAKNKIVDGVVYERIGPQWAGARVGQLIFQFLLPFYCKKLHYDLWIESYTPPFSTAFLPLFTKKPVIGLTHLLGGKDMAKKYSLPFNFVEQRGIQYYKYFIALTSTIKTRISEIKADAMITIIPNGVNKVKSTNQERKEKYILFIGRIDIKQKGLEILLRVFSQVVDKVEQNIIIAGSGSKDEIEKLKTLINHYGLAKRVIYKGFVKGKEKERLYQESICMVLPSTFETLPITLFEAFQYGCPVIAFDIDDLSWLANKYCIKVTPFDEREFALKLLNLLEKKTLRQRLSKEVKNYVKQYDWETIARAYKNFIEKILVKESPVI